MGLLDNLINTGDLRSQDDNEIIHTRSVLLSFFSWRQHPSYPSILSPWHRPSRVAVSSRLLPTTRNDFLRFCDEAFHACVPVFSDVRTLLVELATNRVELSLRLSVHSNRCLLRWREQERVIHPQIDEKLSLRCLWINANHMNLLSNHIHYNKQYHK